MMSIENLQTERSQAEPFATKTIILWGQDDLLMQAAESLLASQKNWQVIRISDQADEAKLAEQVQVVNPQVLIVHQDTLFRNPQLLIKFVQTCSELKIITINLDNNGLEIFHKQTTYLKEVSDLISIIAEDFHIKGGQANSQTSFEPQFPPVPCTAKNKKEE